MSLCTSPIFLFLSFSPFFLLGGRGLCVCACIFRLDIRILSHSLSPLCSPNPITLDSFTIPRDYNRMPWPPPPRPCHAAGAVRAARGPSRNDFSYFFSLLSTSFYSHQHFVRAGAGRTYERKIIGIKPNVRKKNLFTSSIWTDRYLPNWFDVRTQSWMTGRYSTGLSRSLVAETEPLYYLCKFSRKEARPLYLKWGYWRLLASSSSSFSSRKEKKKKNLSSTPNSCRKGLPPLCLLHVLLVSLSFSFVSLMTDAQVPTITTWPGLFFYFLFSLSLASTWKGKEKIG